MFVEDLAHRSHISGSGKARVQKSDNSSSGGRLASHPCFSAHARKLGRPGQLCDVMMTCGHYLGHCFKISTHSPTHST